ncbi:MAG: hypothetical protein LBE81_01855 [Azonexus sp.]|jgi:hypothetical protein|uniref:hypothetical protein n=1 Tax=Azonexus sp. TaxID=1872668 RepID=UPI0028386B1E|nr:hypothetical protein [Azonexus sp.]MDR0775370.1 hypothetical protein [Azonexus sp.]
MADKLAASIPMLGAGAKSMKISPSMAHRLALAAALSLLIAIALVIVIPQFKPGLFGSNFEGGSGYMALLIFTPSVVLALTPILVLLLRYASPLACLSIWFLVQLVLGFFYRNFFWSYWLGNALWLGGLVALSWKIVKQWRSRTWEKNMVNDRFYWLPVAALLLAAYLPLTACSQPAGDAPKGEKKMSVRQDQKVYLDVAGYDYLERPVFDILLNGIEIGSGGSLVVGVPIKLGPQVVTWRLGGPKGMPGNGDTVKAANIPELNSVDQQFRYLGVHIYPDNTVELIPDRFWPERTERGEAFIHARKQKNGQ